MHNAPDENNEEDWYPFDKEEPTKKKSIFEGIDPVLGSFGLFGWGCFGCVVASICGFLFAAGTAGVLESTQDRRPIDFESAEALWLIVGWSLLFFVIFATVSALAFYLLRQREL